MSTEWQILSPIRPQTKEEVIEILLNNRELRTPSQRRQFLAPTPASQLESSALDIPSSTIKEMTTLIESHVKRNSHIAVYGDYDVDGICSTAILWETLYNQSTHVFPHIPHRESEGYGLSKKGIDICIEKGAQLIIAVDNGIVAHREIAYAKSLGIDIIIVDHHVPDTQPPPADLIIHSQHTSAAGICYFLSRAMHGNPNHIELAAISAICDLVPLTGINRSIVTEGLASLRTTRRQGLKELFSVSALDPGKIGVYEIGFVIGPRLNAMGRLEHAIDSLRLLCTPIASRAHELSRLLDATNKDRQTQTANALTTALEGFSSLPQFPHLLITASPDYSPGIIGLIASKLTEKYSRPSIAISLGDSESKASVRSVTGFDVTAFLRTFPDLFLTLGGHSMAAGFSFDTHRLAELTTRLQNQAEQQINPKLLKRVIKIDVELLPELLNLDLSSGLLSLAPFGLGNPKPLFVTHNLTLSELRSIGKSNQHLKLLFTSPHAQPLEAVAFNPDTSWELKPGAIVDAVFQLDTNRWNSREKIQLVIKDLKPL